MFSNSNLFYSQKKVELSIEEVINIYKQIHSLPEWVLSISNEYPIIYLINTQQQLLS